MSTAAYHACLEDAIKQAPILAERWFAKLSEALYAHTMDVNHASDKRQLQAALAALKVSRVAIERGFALQLTQALADDTRALATGEDELTPGAVRPKRSLASVRFDELELMGDEQVQQTLNNARFQQAALRASESGLVAFAALLSSAQGFDVVRADKNPLRPEVVATALIQLLEALPVDADCRTRWMAQGAPLLGEELQALYLRLAALLTKSGVEPAAYAVISTPEEPARRSKDEAVFVSAKAVDGPSATVAAAKPRAESAVPSSRLVTGSSAVEAPRDSRSTAPVDQLLTLDHLRQLLAGGFDASFASPGLASAADAAIHPQFSHTVPAALDVLAELEEKRLASQTKAKPRPQPPQPVALLRERLKTDAKSLGQSLAIEVVGLMIEQLVSDGRLLPSVRRVLADAEPAFLRLAVSDPRFFSHKNHPARLLLETITDASLAFAQEDAAGFQDFLADLQAVAEGLTEEHASDAQHFADLIGDFEARQAQRKRDASAEQSKAVRALLHAEQRNLLAEKIAFEVRARHDFTSYSRVLTLFLTGPWAQVMAHERLHSGAGGIAAPKATYSLMLSDVLWSLNGARASRDRARLAALIPTLVSALRAGLRSIDFPLEKAQPFFDELMACHQAALRPGPPLAEVTAPQRHAANRAELERAFEARDADAASVIWVAPNEAQDSGFMVDWDSPQGVSSDFQATQPLPRDALESMPLLPDRPNTPSAIGQPRHLALKLGVWVDLLTATSAQRMQLAWISPSQSLFMFHTEAGTSHSMTATALQQLLAKNRITLVEGQGVVDDALDGVVRIAVLNSVLKDCDIKSAQTSVY